MSLRILNRGVALAGVALHFDARALTAARHVLEVAQIRFDLDVTDRKAVDREFIRRLQSHRVVLAHHVLVPQKIRRVRCQGPPALTNSKQQEHQ